MAPRWLELRHLPMMCPASTQRQGGRDREPISLAVMARRSVDVRVDGRRPLALPLLRGGPYDRKVLSIVVAKQSPKTSTCTTIVAVIVVIVLFALLVYAANKFR